MENQIKSKKASQKLKAVVYVRSCQVNLDSIERQIRECKEYAEKNNIIIFDTYIDNGFSGISTCRPEFQRMVRDSTQQIFNTILVWQLDRFSRDRYDSAYYRNILEMNNVKVISAKENMADNASNVLLESIIKRYDDYCSIELSKRIKQGLNAKKINMIGGK